MTHACYCVTKHNAPLQRMDCPTPDPKGAEVLIRMTGVGVCRTQPRATEFSHVELAKQRARTRRFGVGYCFAGRVTSRGSMTNCGAARAPGRVAASCAIVCLHLFNWVAPPL